MKTDEMFLQCDEGRARDESRRATRDVLFDGAGRATAWLWTPVVLWAVVAGVTLATRI